MTTFKDVPMFAYFMLNGSNYQKRSSRTGWNLQGQRPFYVGAEERVEVVPAP